MRLEDYCRDELTLTLEGVGARDDALRRIAEVAAPHIEGVDEEKLFRVLLEREDKTPTSTPEGVAFPHALLPDLEGTIVVVASAKPGVQFGVKGHPESDLIFAMFGPEERPWDHVRLLARIARVVLTPGALERLRSAASPPALYEALIAEDRTHV